MAVLMTGGIIHRLQAEDVFDLKKKVKLRFLVASDNHYGQPNTAFEELTKIFVEKANAFHATQKIDFTVINGDIINDDPAFLIPVKAAYDGLKMPYYVSRGNHDKVATDVWEKHWSMGLNHTFTLKSYTFIVLDSSNIDGKYVSPDLGYLKQQLDAAFDAKGVYLFIHIPQHKWEEANNGIETPAFYHLIKNYSNIKAVFHGHDHNQDGIYIEQDVPFIFDSHIAGSWGTDYNGFRIVEVLADNTALTYMMNPDIVIKKAELN